jgi:integrase
MGLLAKAPRIEMPKLAGGFKGKHRALSGEEAERMIATVPKVRPHDAPAWQRLLRGLWLSGLRMSEAVALTWDDGPFVLDTTGRYPAFVIDGDFQKSRRSEVCPVTPDFVEWILAETPEAERVGRVFPLPGLRDGSPMAPHRASEIVSAIGKRAGVVVGTTETVTRENGRLVRTPEKMYAGAHDCRRAFCTKWAKRKMPPVVQRLARHANIATTMGFYVALDADEIAADLWADHGATDGNSPARGNNHGNIDENRPSESGSKSCRKPL